MGDGGAHGRLDLRMEARNSGRRHADAQPAQVRAGAPGQGRRPVVAGDGAATLVGSRGSIPAIKDSSSAASATRG